CEYPWLWFNGLAAINWSGARLVDIGSEISPIPWFLALKGARVTLIETSREWIPIWENLRAKLHVDVDWHIVDSEKLPVPDASAALLARRVNPVYAKSSEHKQDTNTDRATKQHQNNARNPQVQKKRNHCSLSRWDAEMGGGRGGVAMYCIRGNAQDKTGDPE